MAVLLLAQTVILAAAGKSALAETGRDRSGFTTRNLFFPSLIHTTIIRVLTTVSCCCHAC